jgi:hypothetical protein
MLNTCLWSKLALQPANKNVMHELPIGLVDRDGGKNGRSECS